MKCCRGPGSNVICISGVAFAVGIILVALFPLRFLLLLSALAIILLGLIAIGR